MNVFNCIKKLILASDAMCLSACASVVSDNDTKTQIGSDPQPAKCTLNGTDFTRTITTPSSVVLPSDAAPITVTCTANAHFSTSYNLDTAMDGWILGNILIGGCIGFVIDAVRGASQKYPENITIKLEPSSFKTATARDQFYEERIRTAEAQFTKLIEQLEIDCANDGGDTGCPDRLQRAKEKRVKELRG
jgi:hypothetical protein